MPQHSPRPFRLGRSRAAALVGALGALVSASRADAQAPAARLLVVDDDAHHISLTNAGALFNVDMTAPPGASPRLEVAADQGVPAWQLLSGLALSPFDGRAYVTDLNAASIYSVTGGSSTALLVSNDAQMVAPFSLAFLPDGRLVLADPEADPSALGPDDAGGVGHGALLTLDPQACNPPCPLTLLANGANHPSLPAISGSAFQDPVGVAYDRVRNVLYVADSTADVLGLGSPGAIFSVDPSTGEVRLVSAGPCSGAGCLDFALLFGIAVRRDGTILVADGPERASVVWSIDPANADPQANYRPLSSGTQYAALEGVTVDAADRVFVVDSGIFDIVTMTYTVPPRVFRIDETNPNPAANAVVVNESPDLVTPVAVAAVPASVPASVTPSAVVGPTTVVVRGEGLDVGLQYYFSPDLLVSNVAAAPGLPAGEGVQMTVTPTIPIVGLPLGCGAASLYVTNPFGGRAVLAGAVTIGDTSGFPAPGPPCSPRGDANCDGIVDGLDLGILGRAYAAQYCDGPGFVNDADFTNDDLIDGTDLAVLATWFGLRP